MKLLKPIREVVEALERAQEALEADQAAEREGTTTAISYSWLWWQHEPGLLTIIGEQNGFSSDAPPRWDVVGRTEDGVLVIVLDPTPGVISGVTWVNWSELELAPEPVRGSSKRRGPSRTQQEAPDA